jgi:sugar phosphate permease
MLTRDGTQVDAVPAANAKIGRSSGYRWVILLMLGLMALITFIDRTNISVAAPDIAKEFGFSKTQLGWIFGVFGFAYALGQIPGGWLSDTYGARKVLAIVVLFWSFMTMATALATGFVSMLVIRFVFGLGEASAWPAATRAMQYWFPRSERGLVNGITHSCGQFATTLVPLAGVAIMTAWGWRAVFYLFGTVGIVWAIAWYFLHRDLPSEHPKVNAAELACIEDREAGETKSAAPPPCPPPQAGAGREGAIPWGLILTSRNMWFIAAAYCGYTYGSYFFWYWMPSYLIEFHHFSLAAMGLLAPLPLFAGALGVLAGGVLTDIVYRRTGTLKWSRRAVCIAGMLGASIMMVPSALVSDPVLTVFLLAICNFFISLILGPSWAAAMDVAGGFSGSVSSVMNMVGQAAGSVSAIIFGALVDHVSWFAPFFVISAVMLGSALLWAFLIDPERLVTDRS